MTTPNICLATNNSPNPSKFLVVKMVTYDLYLKLSNIRRVVMEKRSPIGVFVLSLVTLGIYSIYWLVKTKGELNQRGASIPTAWLIIVPFVNI